MKKALLFLLLSTVIFSCTENQRARNFGGSTEIKLEAGYMLVNATWKEHSLWYLVAPMPKGYIPTSKIFYEDSSFGVLNGKVTFIETSTGDMSEYDSMILELRKSEQYTDSIGVLINKY